MSSTGRFWRPGIDTRAIRLYCGRVIANDIRDLFHCRIRRQSLHPGKNPRTAQLIVRMNRQERDEFVALCEELDTSAAREVRRFIRKFLKQERLD